MKNFGEVPRYVAEWRMDRMANHYVEIDEKTWPRAMHCMVFRNSVEPAFCVTSSTSFLCRWTAYWTICRDIAKNVRYLLKDA